MAEVTWGQSQLKGFHVVDGAKQGFSYALITSHNLSLTFPRNYLVLLNSYIYIDMLYLAATLPQPRLLSERSWSCIIFAEAVQAEDATLEGLEFYQVSKMFKDKST